MLRLTLFVPADKILAGRQPKGILTLSSTGSPFKIIAARHTAGPRTIKGQRG
jgi:hypothetical protein